MFQLPDCQCDYGQRWIAGAALIFAKPIFWQPTEHLTGQVEAL
jgi:hypothetical protein